MPGNGGWNIDYDGSGTNGAVLSTDDRGAEPIDRGRNNVILLGSLRHVMPLTCGSRQSVYLPAAADTYEDHPDYVDIEIDWDKLKGDVGDTWTVVAKVSLRCVHTDTTVTPRIVEAGTTTAAGTGSAHTTTSWAVQSITIASSTGVKSYRLQIKRSNLTHGVQVIAEVRLYV